MKEKLFDLVLVMLLLIVAFAVGLTLFGPGFRLSDIGAGFGSSGKNSNSVTQVQVNDTTTNPSNNDLSTVENANTAEVSVIVPSVDLPTIRQVDNNPETATDNQTEAVSDNSNSVTEPASSSNQTQPQAQEAVVIAQLPDGAIDLQSIGFSYVTGGAGACGITLEAWKHVAVSRDILAKYPCGTKVTINIDKPINGHSSFTAVVGDTMNKKHSRTVNIYVAKSEPALEYGRQTGDLIP